jgi:competence CoiA-like predicted nuclease
MLNFKVCLQILTNLYQLKHNFRQTTFPFQSLIQPTIFCSKDHALTSQYQFFNVKFQSLSTNINKPLTARAKYSSNTISVSIPNSTPVYTNSKHTAFGVTTEKKPDPDKENF